jgi:hypothetical protein
MLYGNRAMQNKDGRGFADICLKRWVLRVAGIGFKTKKKKSYTVMFVQGDTAEHE